MKFTQSFKEWIICNAACISLGELFFYFALDGQWREAFLWIIPLFFLGFSTFMLFLMEWQSKSYQKRKQEEMIETGEASPYFIKKYTTGTITAYKNTVTFRLGSNRVNIDVDELISVVSAIKLNRGA